MIGHVLSRHRHEGVRGAEQRDSPATHDMVVDQQCLYLLSFFNIPFVAALDDVIDGKIVRRLRCSVEPIRISVRSRRDALGQVEHRPFVVVALLKM